MVIDHIRNRALYYGMGEDIRAALDFFAAYHDDAPVNTDVTIPDTDILVRIRPCMTEAAEKRPFETHYKYFDIHYVAAGLEGIGYANREDCPVLSFDEKADAALINAKGPVLVLPEGWFMITLPEDAHQPCVAIGEPCKINKLIAKIKIK